MNMMHSLKPRALFPPLHQTLHTRLPLISVLVTRQNSTLPPSPPSTAPAAAPTPTTKQSITQKHLPRLHAISTQTGVPLPSLMLSFLVLHEVTAFLPLVLLFFIFQALGSGAYIVEWISGISTPTSSTRGDQEVDGNEETGGWEWRGVVRSWFLEGEKRVEKVGKKYGILGYNKVEPGISEEADIKRIDGVSEDAHELSVTAQGGSSAAEKVANAISAYVVVKALLPFRIGVSIAAAPAFARFALLPFRRLIIRKPVGKT